MPYKDDEIKQLLREEQSRGRRPPPAEEIYRARIKKLKDFRKALESGNWNLFKKMLNGYGLKEGTKEWNDAEKIWNQSHGPRYR